MIPSVSVLFGSLMAGCSCRENNKIRDRRRDSSQLGLYIIVDPAKWVKDVDLCLHKLGTQDKQPWNWVFMQIRLSPEVENDISLQF